MGVVRQAYLPLPNEGEFAIALAAVKGRERARRKPRVSKLMPHTLRISAWLSTGHSYQRICDLILQLSQLKVHRSTLMRFIRANPLLPERPEQSCATPLISHTVSAPNKSTQRASK
jgi:hypothetical protein